METCVTSELKLEEFSLVSKFLFKLEVLDQASNVKTGQKIAVRINDKHSSILTFPIVWTVSKKQNMGYAQTGGFPGNRENLQNYVISCKFCDVDQGSLESFQSIEIKPKRGPQQFSNVFDYFEEGECWKNENYLSTTDLEKFRDNNGNVVLDCQVDVKLVYAEIVTYGRKNVKR